MTEEMKALLRQQGLEEGYTNEQLDAMIESGNMIFGDLL